MVETLRPSLETRARALGLKSKISRPSTAALIDEEELRRFQWATKRKAGRVSRTEVHVEADNFKRQILDKARKDSYKATVSGLYDKSFRGCPEAKTELAKAQYFGYFGLKVGESGAAYSLMDIRDRDEDAQDAVVAAFQAKRKRHFDRCFRGDLFDYFSEEDEELNKRAPMQNPRVLIAVPKAEAAEILSSRNWLVSIIITCVNK